MEQVKEKYGAENVYYVERPRKHRYVIFNAPQKRRKELLSKLKYKVQEYPKMPIFLTPEYSNHILTVTNNIQKGETQNGLQADG